MGKRFEDIKTGVIGVGSMGSKHVKTYDKISKLVGVYDIDKARQTEVAKWIGCNGYDTLGELLKNVDAVSIAVPTYLHREIAEQVAKDDVHMLVEKPLATTVEDSQRIINAASEAGVVLAVGHTENHNPIVEYIRGSLREHRFSIPITFSTRRVSNYPKRVTDMGVVLDLLTHDVGVLCDLIGREPNSVSALGGCSRYSMKFEDYATLQLDFGDVIGFCEANWRTPMIMRTMNITTSSCYIEVDYQRQEARDYSLRFGNVNTNNHPTPPIGVNSNILSLQRQPKDDIVSAEIIEPLAIELTDFLDSVEKRRKPLITGQSGLAIVRIAEATLESIRTREVVKL